MLLETYTDDQIEQLVLALEQGTLPAALWTHDAHIIVACWYCFYFDETVAFEKMKRSIIHFNETIGTANNDVSGYHETLTRFWVMLIKRYTIFHGCTKVEHLVESIRQAGLADKNLPLKFYSKAFLYATEARHGWMPPNKLPVYHLNIVVDPGAEQHYQLSDFEFEEQFADCTLNPIFFSHEAHIRLAYIHIKNYGIDKAIQHITRQIQAFAQSAGDAKKYHATLTVAAIYVVHHFMTRSKSGNFYDFVQEFPQLKTDFKALIGSHYSSDIYRSESARNQYQEPDLLPFYLV